MVTMIIEKMKIVKVMLGGRLKEDCIGEEKITYGGVEVCGLVVAEERG